MFKVGDEIRVLGLEFQTGSVIAVHTVVECQFENQYPRTKSFFPNQIELIRDVAAEPTRRKEDRLRMGIAGMLRDVKREIEANKRLRLEIRFAPWAPELIQAGLENILEGRDWKADRAPATASN